MEKYSFTLRPSEDARKVNTFMFTGIITHTGKVADISRSEIKIRASKSLVRKLDIGASISVNGTCLTVTQKKNDSFTADVTPETRVRTNLRYLKRGELVNLELPTTPNSFLSGHLVQGHIDGTARLEHIIKKGASRILKFSLSPTLAKYVVEKGSIAVDGIALTVVERKRRYFSVGIIPHTWGATAMNTIRIGAMANIEVDIIAKYVEKLMQKRS